MNDNTQRKVYEIEVSDLLSNIAEIDDEIEVSDCRNAVDEAGEADYTEFNELWEVRDSLYDQLKAKRNQLKNFNIHSEHLANLETELRTTKGFDNKTLLRRAITATNEALIATVRGA